MSEKTTKSYIEEYEIAPGQMGSRLREKVTGRKVDLGTASTQEQAEHFMLFLGAAHAHKETMPNVFEKDGDADFIFVSGEVDFDAPDEIRYVYNDALSYGFA